MKYLTQIIRFIVGIVFIFSGTVKAIDVMGTAYKLEEYFSPIVFNIPFLAEHSEALALVFILLEIMLGVFLILGFHKKFTLIALLLIMLFFSFLTYYSARYNVVDDCGCFGDFIKLNPWTSFYKDLILLGMIILLFVGYRYIKPLFSQKTTLLIVLISFLIAVFIEWHGLARLPLVDFRPFAVGKDIRDGLQSTPEDRVNIYKLKNLTQPKDTFIDSKAYINTGIWKDTLNWELDPTYTKDSIIKKEIPAKIKNFEIEDAQGNIIKDEILDDPKLMLIVFPTSDYNEPAKEEIIQLINKLQKADPQLHYRVLGNKNGIIPQLPSATLDDATMKQMIRSNPGVLLLSSGVVKAKYHYKTLPKDPQIILKPLKN